MVDLKKIVDFLKVKLDKKSAMKIFDNIVSIDGVRLERNQKARMVKRKN